MNTKYKITITKIKEKTYTRKGDWGVIDKVPWDQESLGDKSIYGGIDKFVEKTPLKEVMGYAPSYQSTKEEETKVLEQTVDNIDLTSVIKAINGIA